MKSNIENGSVKCWSAQQHDNKVSQILHHFMWSPHKHEPNQMLYRIHNHKKDHEHTTYPTPIKLNVKNNDHAYNEQLIPHRERVVTSC